VSGLYKVDELLCELAQGRRWLQVFNGDLSLRKLRAESRFDGFCVALLLYLAGR